MMRGWSITLLLAATLALAGLAGPSAAMAKCPEGTTKNPYCQKPPPCRDHKCTGVASNLTITYSTRR
jgi:hypothetical protein